MKIILSTFLAVALLASAAQAAPSPTPAKPRDITTKDGMTYHHATIMGSTSTQIMLSCDEGTIYVPLDNLPNDIQKEIGYKGPGVKEKEDAEKAAALKAQAEKAALDKQSKIESSKHEIVRGTEKDPYPQLNPDFFPDELATEIAAYNTTAQYNVILSQGQHSPDTDATIKSNAQKLTALHAIYLEYKKFMAEPPVGTDVAAASKAVADSDYKPYLGMPEIAYEAIRGVPDKVETVTGDDKIVKKIYHYGDHQFGFADGKYWGDPEHPPKVN
jgi:hypothetical protein